MYKTSLLSVTSVILFAKEPIMNKNWFLPYLKNIKIGLLTNVICERNYRLNICHVHRVLKVAQFRYSCSIITYSIWYKTSLLLMIHSATSDHYSHLKFVLFCKILKSGDGWTYTTCENSNHHRPKLWVGPRGSIKQA